MECWWSLVIRFIYSYNILLNFSSSNRRRPCSNNPTLGFEVCNFTSENIGKPPERCPFVSVVYRRFWFAFIMCKRQQNSLLEPKLKSTKWWNSYWISKNKSMELWSCLVSKKSGIDSVFKFWWTYFNIFSDGW